MQRAIRAAGRLFFYGGKPMKNPFSGLFRARDKPQDSVSAAPVFYFGTSGSGKSVTVQSAIQLSTVYACVRVISETVASLPLGVYESTDAGNLKATDHPQRKEQHRWPVPVAAGSHGCRPGQQRKPVIHLHHK